MLLDLYGIYRFPEPSGMEVVVLENHTAPSYLEAPTDSCYYGDVFDQLRAAALSPIDSQSFIGEVASQLRQ